MKKSTFNATKNFFSVLFVLTLLATDNIYGTAISWTGTAGDGLWSTAGNWSGNAVPGATDDVTIGNGFSVTVNGIATKINSIVVSGTVTVSNGAVLPVEQTTSVNPIVNITGGEIINNGTFNIALPTASSGNSAIYFSNGTQLPVTNSRFTNGGTLNIDLKSSTGHSNASRVIYFNQTTANTKAQFNLGGTVNLLNFTAQARFMELNAGAVEIDGTQTFGTSGTPVNIRFIHSGYSGTLTFLPTANITINSNFSNANGILNMSNTGIASVINKGTITLHAFTVSGSAINIQPQTSGTSFFTNEGTITADGSWATGALYMNGNNAACTATLENKSAAVLSLTNSNSGDPGGSAIRASITPTNNIVNYGTITLSVNAATRAMYLGDNSTEFKNYGTLTTNNAITGNDATNAGVFNNYAEGVVNFNLSGDMSVAVSSNKKIIFNNYGTITGKGVLASGMFKSLTGTINPGIGTGTGIFRIYDTSYTLTGKCIMKINGTATPGTDYDQIIFGYSPTGNFTIDPAATLEVTTGGSYVPAHLDVIPLFTGYTSRTNEFTPANITKPANWTTDYTTATAGLKYLAPSVSVTSDMNTTSLGDLSNSDITIAAGNNLTIDGTTAAKSITAAPGAKITMSSNYSLSTTNGITLQSDETGTATLVDNNTTDPQTVNATVKQYVTEGRNWYMSIPLAGVPASALNKGTSVVMYDEPSGNWIAPALNTLDKMRGYIQTATAAPLTGTTGTVEFSGILNTGAQSIELTRTAGKTGFNLVGNPYPSYLDWNMVSKTNVSNTMWYRTKEESVYKFYTYIANEGAGIGVPANVTNLIPPMQAFWVRVQNEGSGSIAVNNNMRSHKEVSGNILRVSKQESQQLVRLQVSNDVNNDEAVIYFNSNAADSFDRYDAQKRSNENPAIPEIFTQAGNEKLVINGMNGISYNTEIPLGFTTGVAGDFTLKVTELNNFGAGTRIVLKDKQKPESEFDLTGGISYQFSSPAVASSTDRFSLIFRAPGSVTKNEKTEFQNIQVYLNAANQISIIAPEKSNYAVYNGVGQLIENGILNSEFIFLNSKLNAGVYLVKVNNVTNKLIIK